MQGIQQAMQAMGGLRQQTQQTQQQLSQLPFHALQTAIDQFSRSLQNAGNNQGRYREAITQAEQALRQFNVTVNHSGQLVDRFGQQLSQGSAQALRQFQTGIREAQAELAQLQRFGINQGGGPGGSGGLLGHVLGIAGGVGIATTIQGAISQIKAFLGESLSLATQMQNLRLAFTAIEGSGAAANRTLANLFESSQRLGTGFVQTAEAFKRFEASAQGTTLQGQATFQVFQQIQAGARVLGLTNEQLSRSFDALSQMLTKGRVGQEELRQQLAEHIPAATQRLAQGLGITTDVLNQMITTGLMPAEAAVAALARSMGDLARASGIADLERLSATFARLKNETVAWMTALGEAITSVLQPFLADLIKVSEELRRIFGIRNPGQPGPLGGPGASVGGAGLSIAPRSTGFMPPNAFMPSEFEQRQAGPAFLSSRFDALIRQNAARYNLDAAIFSRLIARESNFDPRATGPAIPGQGNARGLGQLMPATGAELGLRSITEFFDPAKNLEASARYLSQLNQQLTKDFTDLEERTKVVLMAYNAGIGHVQKAIEETRRVGERVTAEQVLGRLPNMAETAPYVEFITRVEQATKKVAEAQPDVDPFEQMFLSIQKTITEIPKLQQQLESLMQDPANLNFGGMLGENVRKQADALLERFTGMAEILGRFPQLIERMTPAQQEQLTTMARDMAAFGERLTDVVPNEGEARRRVQEFARVEKQLLDELLQTEKEFLTQRQAQWKALDIFGLDIDPETEKARRDHEEALRRVRQERLKDMDIFGLNLTPDQERLRKFETTIQETLDRLQVRREETTETRLRQRGEREGIPLTDELDAKLRQITQLERWRGVMEDIRHLAQPIARAFTTAFDEIIAGTLSVGQAFARMAQSILKTVSDLLINRAVSALLNMAIGAVVGGVTGGATANTTLNSSSYINTLMGTRMQHGGLVTRPTMALLGEGPPHTLPEYVMNRPQMEALLRAAPSAGGQATGGLTIINVAHARDAERRAAQERALGREVVLNYVADELAQGSGSRLGRMIQTGLR